MTGKITAEYICNVYSNTVLYMHAHNNHYAYFSLFPFISYKHKIQNAPSSEGFN